MEGITRKDRDGVEVWTLRKGAASASVVPAWGFNCVSFECDGPVLEPVAWEELAAKPTSYGIPLLFPFPNRVRDGILRWKGKTWRVDPPRHGFVRQRPWTVVESGDAWLRGRFDSRDFAREIEGSFPGPFVLEAAWRVGGGELTFEVAVSNPGDAPFPWGFGIHPYFHRPPGATIRVPATRYWELEDSLPTGRVLPVTGRLDLRKPVPAGEHALDDILTGLEPDPDGNVRSVLADPASGRSIVIEAAAADFPEIVVYDVPSPRRAICIEPYTSPTDAFTLADRGIDAHLRTVGAGERSALTIRISVRTT